MSLFKSNLVVGITAGVTATIVAPLLLPVIASSGRPLAKALAKGAFALYEIGRKAAANAGEVMEDAIAKASAEQGMRKESATGNEGVHPFGTARNDNEAGDEPAAGVGGV